MSDLALSRRVVTRALFLTPALVAPAAASAAPVMVCAVQRDAAAWDAAMAHYKAVKAEADHFHATIYKPAVEAGADLCPPYRFTHTAKNGQTTEYAIWPDDFAAHEPGAVDMWTFIRPQIDAAQAKHAAYLASPLPAELERLNKQSDHYNELLGAAEEALLCLHAPHLEAVAWKLRHLQSVSVDCVIEPGAIASVMFDVRRLNGEDIA